VREMQESGVINLKEPLKSKAALIYGQMTEPPGARLRVALTGLTVAEVFPRPRKARTRCSSSTTFSVLPRLALRFRRCWAACPPPSATSQTWQRKWASCRSASPRPSAAPSPRCRPCTCLPTTSPIPRRPRPSLTSMRQRFFRARCSELGIYPARRSAGVDLAHPHGARRRAGALRRRAGRQAHFCSVTRISRTSSPSSASTSFLKTTRSPVARARKVQKFLFQPPRGRGSLPASRQVLQDCRYGAQLQGSDRGPSTTDVPEQAFLHARQRSKKCSVEAEKRTKGIYKIKWTYEHSRWDKQS